MKIYENDSIYVRPVLKSDTEKESYIKWFFDQEVCKYNSHGKMSSTYQPVTIDPSNTIHWAVFIKEVSHVDWPRGEAVHIGNVCLNINWINRNAEFTCIFGEKEYWGKGYCSTVLEWMIDHGFNKLNLHKIWLGTANPGMMKAAHKVGMRQEGRLKEHVFLEGKFLDIDNFRILKDRWSLINV